VHCPHAVMCAIPSAADRQIRVGFGHEGQHRRDQREAENEKQHETESASHSAIVASFVSKFVRDMFFLSRNLHLVPARTATGTRASDLFRRGFGGGPLDDEVVVYAEGAGGGVSLHAGDG